MGSCAFYDIGLGTTAREAFMAAQEEREERLRENGEAYEGGYTGSILEKNKFIMIPIDEQLIKMASEAITYRRELDDKIDEMLINDERINTKYKPAGCIKLDEGKYLFFGWAAE